jgi:hypothetical protein
LAQTVSDTFTMTIAFVQYRRKSTRSIPFYSAFADYLIMYFDAIVATREMIIYEIPPLRPCRTTQNHEIGCAQKCMLQGDDSHDDDDGDVNDQTRIITTDCRPGAQCAETKAKSPLQLLHQIHRATPSTWLSSDFRKGPFAE